MPRYFASKRCTCRRLHPQRINLRWGLGPLPLILVATRWRETLASTNATLSVYCPDCDDHDEDFLSVPAWVLPVVVLVFLCLILVAACMGSPFVRAWRLFLWSEGWRRWHAWRLSRRRHAVTPTSDDDDSTKKDLEEEDESPEAEGQDAFSGVLPGDTMALPDLDVDILPSDLESDQAALNGKVSRPDEEHGISGRSTGVSTSADTHAGDSGTEVVPPPASKESQATPSADADAAEDSSLPPTTGHSGRKPGSRKKVGSSGRPKDKKHGREHSPEVAEVRQPLVDGGNVVLTPWRGVRT